MFTLSTETLLQKINLKKLFDKMGYTGDTADDIMKILDSNKDGVLSESEWLEGLDNCEKLKAALRLR